MTHHVTYVRPRSDTMDLVIREIKQEEIKSVSELELSCYPDDEADSYDQLQYRHREARDLMLGCFISDFLIGFICATRYHGRTLTHESMSMHIPNGESVCIHSVAVRYSNRRQGIASKLLREFISKVTNEQRDVARILLICKSNLIPLYTRAGFCLNGKSHIVHGFPLDECEGYDTFLYRHEVIPELTLGCFLHYQLIGMINGCRVNGQRVPTDPKRIHLPDGESVYIGVLCVRGGYRKKGFATILLDTFINTVKQSQSGVQRILLVCKEHHIRFYQKYGFEYNGKSEAVYGFPLDECAGYDKLVYRHEVIPELTLGCFLQDQLIGVESVYISVLCVRDGYRNKGYATKLIHTFTETVKQSQSGVQRILLVCKDHLIQFYQKAGFVCNGKSEAKFGTAQWYEMSMSIV